MAAATPRFASPTASRSLSPSCAKSVIDIKGLVNGEAIDYKDSTLRLPWAGDSRCDVWVAAYGPKVLALTGEVGDGFILQLADPSIAEWTIGSVRAAAVEAGRAADAVYNCVAAPAYITDGSESRTHTHAINSAGSEAWWATTLPTSSTVTATAVQSPKR